MAQTNQPLSASSVHSIVANLERSPYQLESLVQGVLAAIQADLSFDRIRLYVKSGRMLVGAAHIGMTVPFRGLVLDSQRSSYLTQLSQTFEVSIETRQSRHNYFYDDVLDRNDVNAWATMPLVIDGQLIGCLIADNKYSQRPLGPFHAERLKAFAPLAAIAVHVTRLLLNESDRISDIETERVRLELILNAAPTGVILNDSEGRIQFANQKATALLDYEAEGLAGIAVTAIYADAEEAVAVGRALRQLTKNNVFRRAVTLLSRNGARIPAQLTVAMVQTVTDNLIVGFFEDRRPQLAAQEQLAAAQQASASLLRSLYAFTTAEQAWQHVLQSAVDLADGRAGRILFLAEPHISLYPIIATGDDSLSLAEPVAPDGMTHEIVRSNEIRIIPNVASQPELANHSYIRRNIKAAVGFPVKHRDTGEACGVLWLYYKTAFTLPDWKIDIIATLLSQASDLIHILEEKEHALDHLDALDAMVQAAKSGRDETELLQLIARQALQVTSFAGRRAHHCHIVRIQNQRHLQIGSAHPALDTAAIQQVLDDVDLQSNDQAIGIIGLAALHKKPFIVPDVRNNPNYIAFHQKTQSEIAVPIFHGTDVYAVINVEHPDLEAFGERELRLLINLANHASTALQIAPMFARERRYSTAMTALSSMSQSLNIEMLLQEIAEQVHQLLRKREDQISYASIWLCDAKRQQARVQAAFPRESIRYINGINDGIIDLTGDQGPIGMVGRCIVSGEAKVEFNLEENGDYIKSFPQTRSELVVPILFHNSVIGAINAEHAQEQAFDDVDLETLKSFARSAADAIIGAQIRSALNDTGQSLAQESQLHRLLPLIAEKVYELTSASGRPASLCYVSLLKGKRLVFEAFHPRERFADLKSKYAELDLVKGPLGINGLVALKGEPVLASDVRAPEWHDIYIPYDDGIRCSLGMPIKIDDKVVGVITVEHADTGAFDLYHQQILNLFATHAAIAIRKAQEHEETNELRRVAEKLTQTTEREELLRHSLQGALKLAQAELASIKFWDPVAATFLEAYRLAGPAATLESYSTRARLHDGYTRQVAETGLPLVIDDISTDSRASETLRQEGWRSMILIPLTLRRAVAVVTLCSKNQAQFTAKLNNLLFALFSQTEIALERIATMNDLQLLGPHNFSTWWTVIKDRMGHRISSDVSRIRQELDTLKSCLLEAGTEERWLEQMHILESEIEELNHLLPLEYSTNPRTVRLNEQLRHYFNHFEKRTRFRHLDIELDLQADLDELAGVQVNDLFREVLNTVMENSARALRQQNDADPRIIIRTSMIGDRVQISIRDFGPGVPAAITSYLFRKPIEHSQGKGIGLWQADGFLKAIGGSITHNSPENGGCEMIITLPVVPAGH
ncbi:MAG: GAF domain-containing protein [Anaerolineales bacterium]|nr:GAF domain-containing protein [Anaerolineales bacterium]MCB0010522.1 GAF domain-containing protein [Anaerolineales bacterium]MCB0016836.1 GAF domain-containing protein [Anaerolineales bacterium]MCB8960171.1 GAF domain-containing protein [Ardenticatenales bacterium]